MLQKEDTKEAMAPESRSLVLSLPAWVGAQSNRISEKPHSDGSWGQGAPATYAFSC
jgi:hypothetical protein